ncbi:MAG TPA: hypothetical protein VEC37_04630 [Bacillota bacterium]|nr:hypothetical protein [Bacillota bacterium]
MADFQSFTGFITFINDFWGSPEEGPGCIKSMTVEDNAERIVNFIVTPDTYFVEHQMVTEGDHVTGFYDASLPVPAIYPPQLQAIAMAKVTPCYDVKLDYFDSQLVSSDGTLKLNISPTTQIKLENGQRFPGNPANRNLLVIYGPTTRSIPAQTTPYQIIVMCYQPGSF